MGTKIIKGDLKVDNQLILNSADNEEIEVAIKCSTNDPENTENILSFSGRDNGCVLLQNISDGISETDAATVGQVRQASEEAAANILKSCACKNALEFYNPAYIDIKLVRPSDGLRVIALDTDDGQSVNVTGSYLISPETNSFVTNTVHITPTKSGYHKFGLAAVTNGLVANIASVQMLDSNGTIIPFPSQPGAGNNKKVVKFSSFSGNQLFPHAGAGTGTTGYGDASPDGTLDAWVSNAYGLNTGPYYLGKGTGNGVTCAKRDTSMSQDGDGACLKITTMDTGDIVSAGGIYSTTQNTDYTFTFYYRRPTATNHDTIIKIMGGTPTGTQLASVNIAKAATTNWSQAVINFNSGTAERIFVLVIGAGATWSKTGDLYLDNICLECEMDLPDVPDMPDLVQDYVGKSSITEIQFNGNTYKLKYPEDQLLNQADSYISTLADNIHFAKVLTSGAPLQKDTYLFNVATGYLQAAEQYTVQIIWRMQSQPTTIEDYTTYSDADKVALVSEQCSVIEPLCTGGYWVGDPIGNRRTAAVTILPDNTRPFVPRALAIGIETAIGNGAEVYVSIEHKMNEGSFCTTQVLDQYGVTTIPLYDESWSPDRLWSKIYICITNLDPTDEAVKVDKLAIYGEVCTDQASYLEVTGNKRVTFDNVVRAGSFDGRIDDGSLDIY